MTEYMSTGCMALMDNLVLHIGMQQENTRRFGGISMTMA
jgi:hypothetical protein